MQSFNYPPSELAIKLENVAIAEHAPNSILMRVLWEDQHRGFEEEFDVGKLRLEAGEEVGEGAFVAGEVIVPASVVVVQSTNLAELELSLFVIALLLLMIHVD